MRAKLRKVGMISLALMSCLTGSMTAYAAGTGEVSQVQTAKPVTYNQQSVRALGSWENQSNGTWIFKQFSGEVLKNAWIESLTEAGAYYFVGADGVMLVNSQTPDGYTVDRSGVWREPKSGVTTTQESSEDRSNGQPQLKDYDSSNAYYEALANWLINETEFKNVKNYTGPDVTLD